MKKVILIVFLFALVSAAFVFARIFSASANFKAAEDFPRDALIYIQIRDLSAFIKLWSESEFRRKYMESENFGDFQSNHLALKLAARADEIQSAVGIFPDLDFAAGLSETSAALAVYDVGRMEFVFVAPMSEEKILASSLFQLQSGFEEIRLDDGTIIYSKEIEVDRARQRQKIFFANFRGRLILATSEKYFRQTLDNISGKTPKNRLSAEPLFRPLAEKTKPNLATVWLNQEKLNDDWYFKHYWLMSATEKLENLRAGMFDFEIEDKKLVEKRVFLTKENRLSNKLSTAAANRASRLIPENIPFYKIETVGADDSGEAVSDVLFDAKFNSESGKTAKKKETYYFRDWQKSYSYSYLDNDFSEQVNEIENDETVSARPDGKTGAELAKIIGAANPQVSVKLFSPEIQPSPLFFENRKALIFSLQNAGNLDRRSLENAISRAASRLFTVNNQTGEFVWTDFAVGNLRVRQMTMPALGWKIFYCAQANELIFANSEDLLKAVLEPKKNSVKFAETFERVTVINLQSGRETFDGVFQTLESDEAETDSSNADNFFTRNIGSLLDAVSDVERIEIRQTSAQNFLFEEIDFVLKENSEEKPDKQAFPESF